MSDKTITFRIKQLEAELRQIFVDLIDMSDCKGRKKNDQENTFISRALAAYSLHILADVSPSQAAEAIVDGFDDNGIDALLFHKQQNTLWLVQSKWVANGQKSPVSKDMTTFSKGIFDLLDYADKYERFNDKFERKEEEIESAFNSPGLKIKVVIAYSASNLSKKAREVLDDCIKELNDNGCENIASFHEFDLEKAFQAVINSNKQEDIEVKFSLSNWGRVQEPYQAIYGQINAVDVAEWWVSYKNRLFSKNIREFIGGSNVNTQIRNTIENESELFWYLNNGITVLCKDITKVSPKKDRIRGEFIANGISIVNGAQTIGSIGALYQEESSEKKEKLEEAEIFIRFISLDKCPDDFGLKVTKATNTQNRVETRDFVALDPEQERLHKEFISCGRKYHYKRTAEAFEKDNINYELEEATVTLACANDDINLAITAKQELSKLWSDTSQYPYTALFNSKINATQVWRQIDVKREVNTIIKNKQKQPASQIESSLLNYGNLFLLHMIFKLSNQDIFSAAKSEDDFRAYKKIELPQLLDKTLKLSENYLDKIGKFRRLWTLFNSPKRSSELKSFIMQNK